MSLAFTPFVVPRANYYPSRDGTVIDTIILHTTVGTVAAAIARFKNPLAIVSAQWIAALDGQLYRGVDEAHTAYANGVWSENQRAVAIECEDGGDYNGPRTDALYATAGELVAEIRSRHPITRLLVHRDVYSTECPDALDVGRIYGGGTSMTFDPRNNPADRQWLDDLYANKANVSSTIESMKFVYNPVAAWWAQHGFGTLPQLHVKRLAVEREPDTNMKGEPPRGHPEGRR